MADKKLNIYDLRHRLNKLKCCFSEKAADYAMKQKFGKVCKEEKCNLQLLGAYIEMIECMHPVGCNCYTEWVQGGSLIWDENTSYIKDQIVKVYPRASAVGSPSEFLLMRWTNALPSFSFVADAAGEGGSICWEDGNLVQTGYISPCYDLINIHGWSVCGNVKVAWQAQGSYVWNPNMTYQYGDIVKFQGGGNGLNQTGQNQFYISRIKNNFANAANLGFHESTDWVLLECFDLIV
tara:strand:+ start:520 stop:1227 length:708 start_codon:yes stop_codon:yes gene_type:complete